MTHAENPVTSDSATLSAYRGHGGAQGDAALRQYLKSIRQLAITKTRRSFLLRCKKNRIMPNFITNASKNYDALYTDYIKPKRVDRFIGQLQLRHLNLVIAATFTHITNLEKQTNRLERHITRYFPSMPVKDLFKAQRDFSKRLRVRRNVTLNSKYDRLADEQNERLGNKEWFKNISQTEIPSNVATLLGLGPKFAINFEKRHIPIPTLISEVEDIVTRIEPGPRRDDLRAVAVNAITNHVRTHRADQTHMQTMIRSMHQEARSFIKRHPEIVIVQADKGNITVAMDKTSYESKMRQHLSDQATYKKVKNIPIPTQQKTNNELVNILFDRGTIDERTRMYLTTYNAIEARMYGTVKIHKPELPIRPIVDTGGTPHSGLSKWMADHLTNAMSGIENYNLKNSSELINRLRHISLEDDDRLVSYDVVSMFTTMPRGLITKALRHYWPQISTIFSGDMTWALFEKLLNFCIDQCSFFTCLGEKYQQLAGLPMGSSLSSVLCDFALTYMLTLVVPRVGYDLKMIKKYVDDLFFIIPAPAIPTLLTMLNNFHHGLSFTHELEDDGKLPYLDCLIIRNDGTIETEIYRKPSHKGRIQNYLSAHTSGSKRSTAMGLIRRSFNLTTQHRWPNVERTLRSTLADNNYPRGLTESWIRQAKHDIITPRPPPPPANTIQQPTEPPVFKCLTYVRDLTEGLCNIFRKNVPGIRIAVKVGDTLRKTLFSSVKDKLPMLQQSGVVYKVPCSECPAVYIGQTKNKLHTRLMTHKNDVTKREPTRSMLAFHSLENHHKFDFERASVEARERHYGKRLILEMVHIVKAGDHSINKRTDVDRLNAVYVNLLRRHNKCSARPVRTPS